MEATDEFLELSTLSKDLLRALEKKGAEKGFRRLLTELYPDTAHFIFELLQNAEDSSATEVFFKLYEDRLEFLHNGPKLFTIKDVRSITNIGDSAKSDDPTSIGKFGVGFKAVFSYTNTPEIHSGNFHFSIKNLIVPEWIGGCSYESKTSFILPFDNVNKTKGCAFAEIKKHLEGLDEGAILFLSNIKKIRIPPAKPVV